MKKAHEPHERRFGKTILSVGLMETGQMGISAGFVIQSFRLVMLLPMQG
jgi:tetrahydromethanopterin S-methyltransferase subunit F